MMLLLLLLSALALPDDPAPLQPVEARRVVLRDPFWAPRIEANAARGIPHALRMCEESGGRLSNFLRILGKKDGAFDGIFFNDSDLYKVLEGAALSLAIRPDPALERRLEEIIDLIAAAQRPDGYLNTYYQLAAMGRLPKDATEKGAYSDLISKHEFYCAGHLIEAAVAHHRTTGRDKFLKVAVKLAEHLAATFGPERRHAVDAHPESELALIKLWQVTGNRAVLELVRFLMDERGRYCGRTIYGEFCQDLDPLIRQAEPVGHCVRAGYLYSAAADLVRLDGRKEYLPALGRLWENTIGKKLYVSGGLGHDAYNEGFAPDYDLSNANAYNETCASIALALWAHRMLLIRPEGGIADVFERVLYNGYVSGVSLDGTRSFYVNPMQSDGKIERSLWQGCACCPSNLVRALPAVPGYIYAVRDGEIWTHLYAAGRAEIELGGRVVLTQETRYPWEGRIRIQVDPATTRPFTLALRIPGWCPEAKASLNGQPLEMSPRDGYLRIRRDWSPGDAVELDLPMPPRRLRDDPRVRDNAGRVALARGPIVYCLESSDNATPPGEARLPADAALSSEFRADLLGGVAVIQGGGLTAIPYAVWANRGASAMRVWIPETKTALPPPREASATISASEGATGLDALNDGRIPTPAQKKVPRMTWTKAGGNWVCYEFATPIRVWRADLLWKELPAGLSLETWNGSAWAPVKLLHPYDRMADYIAEWHFTILRFEPVETTRMRLTLAPKDGKPPGIVEWRLPE